MWLVAKPRPQRDLRATLNILSRVPVRAAGLVQRTWPSAGLIVPISATPQVLCEFKDIRSNLDARQNRKGNTRSPVKQCADYLREAARGLYGNEAVQPTWGIVTDMNEFRLYWRDTMPAQYQRFIIRPATTDDAISLLAPTKEAIFQRFLFATLFNADLLLSRGGPCPLRQLLQSQGVREREIGSNFYQEYRAYRETL